MIKLLACVLVMSSALIFGMELSFCAKRKLATIEDVCKALELMHGELSARPTLMAELCSELSKKTKGETKLFFGHVSEEMDSLGDICFSQIWENAVSKSYSSLGKQQMDVLNSLGHMLGTFQLADELLAINNCRLELCKNLDDMKENYEKSRKLFLGIPCSLAAMLLVILI